MTRYQIHQDESSCARIICIPMTNLQCCALDLEIYGVKNRNRYASRNRIPCIMPCWLTLERHHNGRDSVSNHQPHDCLLNRLSRRRSKKTSKLRVTGLCAGNSPVPGEFLAQRASNAENVFIWWRHHGNPHNMMKSACKDIMHGDVMPWECFPYYWPFVRGANCAVLWCFLCCYSEEVADQTQIRMMTSSNGNIFRVTDHLCREFTGPQWIPAQRAMTRSFDVFFDQTVE